MKTYKALILGSAAGLLAVGGAQAADLPMKAKAVEYVKICSLYGAGFYYIPGTDTCIRIGGALRLDVAFNAGTFDSAYMIGGTSGVAASNSQAFGKNWFAERARLNLTEDTRTATEYGVLRTYANLQFDWNNNGNSGIAGGAPVEVDYAFIQFAGFTLGKSVSMFDTQWVLSKPTISSGFFSGSNDATGISQLAYTWSFGNGVSATLSLEDGQPYRTAGLVNTSARQPLNSACPVDSSDGQLRRRQLHRQLGRRRSRSGNRWQPSSRSGMGRSALRCRGSRSARQLLHRNPPRQHAS